VLDLFKLLELLEEFRQIVTRAEIWSIMLSIAKYQETFSDKQSGSWLCNIRNFGGNGVLPFLRAKINMKGKSHQKFPWGFKEASTTQKTSISSLREATKLGCRHHGSRSHKASDTYLLGLT